STLTQAALDAFCQKYHIPDTVHPELPAPNQSIHDNPAGKIRVYTSRYYDLDDDVYPTFLTDAREEMDLFAFTHHADPTKVRAGEKQIKEGQVPLLESTRGRVIPLVGRNEQEDQHDNVKDVEPHDLNEEIGDAAVEDQTEESDRLVQGEEVNIVVDENVQTTVAEKPKVQKKRRRAGGASGSDHPPKRLRDDHDTSGNVSSSTAATMPFVTSSVTLTLEHEGGDNTDSISGPNLRTQCPDERFVISSDTSHYSSTNVADVEVTSIVRSHLSPPRVMTAIVTTTVVSSIQSLLPLSNRAFITSPRLLYALSTKPLACGCLTKAKRWQMQSFSHQSLNGPAIKASYSASLLVASNSNLKASGFISINPALKPSTQNDPSMKSVHGSGSSSLTSMGATRESSSGRSTMKSTRICPLIDIHGMYWISYSPSSMLHFCSLPVISGFDNTCLIGWSVITMIGCAWKYLFSCLLACTKLVLIFPWVCNLFPDLARHD
ncbi:hypothetical protein Tco_0886418, partial [Tanacetum coccineum]